MSLLVLVLIVLVLVCVLVVVSRFYNRPDDPSVRPVVLARHSHVREDSQRRRQLARGIIRTNGPAMHLPYAMGGRPIYVDVSRVNASNMKDEV